MSLIHKFEKGIRHFGFENENEQLVHDRRTTCLEVHTDHNFLLSN